MPFADLINIYDDLARFEDFLKLISGREDIFFTVSNKEVCCKRQSHLNTKN